MLILEDLNWSIGPLLNRTSHILSTAPLSKSCVPAGVGSYPHSRCPAIGTVTLDGIRHGVDTHKYLTLGIRGSRRIQGITLPRILELATVGSHSSTIGAYIGARLALRLQLLSQDCDGRGLSVVEARTSVTTESQLGEDAVGIDLAALANSRSTGHCRRQTSI